MLIVLPPIAFALVFMALRRRLRDQCWRSAFLFTAVILGALGAWVIEGLSLLHLIGTPTIAAYWFGVCTGASIFLRCSLGLPQPTRPPSPDEKPSPLVRVLLAGIAIYVLITAMIAVLAPPNTWDVMEYHLPKVMHWIQNGSVSFYPTAIPRQNHLAPGSEYIVMQLHLLSGCDRFSNLVEWFGMLGCLVTVSLIARQLGAKLVGQCVAAVFAVTLPMGIMQATSTQTDYVIAFWFSCFLHFLLRLFQEDAFRWQTLLALATSLGLAVLTKATAYLFAPTFLLWLALWLLKTRRGRAFMAFGAITVVFLLLNVGHYSRNWTVYGHPLGPRQEPDPNTKYGLETHEPKALLSSFSKHIGTHINTPWPSFNASILRGYVSFHKAIGWELNDPRTSFGPSWVKFSIGRTDYQDETAGNPIHFLLALSCGALVFLLPSLRRDRTLFKYALAIAVGALLFVCYLKWHPWMSRLHHGLFIAAAPLVGVVLTRPRREIVGGALAGLMLLLSIPWLLFCKQRPLIAQESIFNASRDRLYFMTPHQSYEAPFQAGREFLSAQKVTQVGLLTGNSSWEYMLWVLLHRDNPAIRLEHVNSRDASSSLQSEPRFSNFLPEAVISLDQRPQPEKLSVGALNYTRRWVQKNVAIYLRD